MEWLDMVPKSLTEKYELHNINHAVEVLTTAYPEHWREIVSALEQLTIPVEHIIVGGGSESPIPKALSAMLRPAGWEEARVSGDLLVKLHRRRSGEMGEKTEHTIKNFIDSHNIDYVKGKVAVDMEWNSKDQTFDRDLYAFRMFYECGVIACGVIITRSIRLNPLFAELGVMKKYGASTTWMGKLIPRIRSGRHGGCPLLLVGITPNVIVRGESNVGA